MNSLKHLWRSALLALLAVWLPNVALADNGKDDLQEFINNATAVNTRASNEVEVDLSKFSATTRTKTLEISTGQTYRFINGTLKSADSFSGYLLSITNSSVVYWGEGAIMKPHSATGKNDPYLSGGIVFIENGEFSLLGGSISNYGNFFGTLIKTSNKSSSVNHINIASGGIYGYIESNYQYDYIRLDGGSVKNIFTNSIGANVQYDAAKAQLDEFINNIDGTQRVHLLITSSLKKPIIFVNKNAYDTNKDKILAEGQGNYALTKSDLSYMRYCTANNSDFDKYELYIESNKVKVRLREESNTVSSADDLQAKLNEIASKGTATSGKPDTIRINPNGIDIDKYITVPSKCFAVLTGGDIKMTNGVKGHYTFGISSNASLSFENIAIDCNYTMYGMNNVLFSYYFGVFGGVLTIGNNVSFKNINGDNNIGLAYLFNGASLNYNSGNYKTSGIAIDGSREYGSVSINGGTIESGGTAIKARYVGIGEATITSHTTVIDCNMLRLSEKSVINCTNRDVTCISLGTTDAFDRGHITGGLYQVEVRELLVMSRFQDMRVYLKADAQLRTFSSSTNPSSTNILTIDGDWGNFTLEQPFMKYIEPDEYKYYKFVNQTTDRDIYYNEKAQTVCVRKSVYDDDDLQGWIDHQPEGDELIIDLPSGGATIGNGNIEIGGDDEEDDLQAFIDGANDDGTSKEIRLVNKGGMRVGGGCHLLVRNINFSNSGSGYIYVKGTLTVDVNVSLVNIRQIIRVLPGGHVIWKGGNGKGTDITKEFFYVALN